VEERPERVERMREGRAGQGRDRHREPRDEGGTMEEQKERGREREGRILEEEKRMTNSAL
jgi:hypothetical protein